MITFAEPFKWSEEMEKLATKLNLRDNTRICILNANKNIVKKLLKAREGLEIDYSIDPRFLYSFFLIFISDASEIDDLAHKAVHNLYDDGILWFAYPGSGSKSDGDKNVISRENDWEALKRMGLTGVTNIIIDEKLNGIRFRNTRYVRSRKSGKNGSSSSNSRNDNGTGSGSSKRNSSGNSRNGSSSSNSRNDNGTSSGGNSRNDSSNSSNRNDNGTSSSGKIIKN